MMTNFNQYFIKWQHDFHQNKQSLSVQKSTIQYYIQNWHKHANNPKQNNIYPLLNQISQKIQKNMSSLQKFCYNFIYPSNSLLQVHKKSSSLRTQVLQTQLKSIRNFLLSNPSIKKYCSPQLKQLNKIHQNYASMFSVLNQQKCFTPKLNYQGGLQQCLMALKTYKNIEELNLRVRSQNGILLQCQIQQLIFTLSFNHKEIINTLQIKFMDMQFQQQKCNKIKFYIKQFKHLKQLKIQNYYRECKLGVFEDFNWYPLKKDTHVFSKAW